MRIWELDIEDKGVLQTNLEPMTRCQKCGRRSRGIVCANCIGEPYGFRLVYKYGWIKFKMWLDRGEGSWRDPCPERKFWLDKDGKIHNLPIVADSSKWTGRK